MNTTCLPQAWQEGSLMLCAMRWQAQRNHFQPFFTVSTIKYKLVEWWRALFFHSPDVEKEHIAWQGTKSQIPFNSGYNPIRRIYYVATLQVTELWLRGSITCTSNSWDLNPGVICSKIPILLNKDLRGPTEDINMGLKLAAPGVSLSQLSAAIFLAYTGESPVS
jgi:hypothetical protein